MDVAVQILHQMTGARCQLRLLGAFAAEPTSFVPQSRKARALLAWLALSGKAMPRDRASALLWSRSGEAQALASLRQCLFELKPFTRATPPILIAGRDRLALDMRLLDLDVAELDPLAAAGEADLLATLLPESSDAVLADLNGIDPMFDNWLADERARLHTDILRAGVACVGSALAAGRAGEAGRLAADLCRFDPLHEGAARAQMAAAAAAGDRDGVRRAWGRIEASLADELSVAPSDETRALHMQLVRAPLPVAKRGHDDPAAARSRRGRRRLVLGAAGALAFAAAAVVGVDRLVAPAAATAITIQPVGGAANPASQDFADALSADFTFFASAMGAQVSVIDADTRPSRSDFAIGLATERQGDELQLQARLARPQDSAVLWSRTFSGDAAKPAGLRTRTAAGLAMVVRCALDAAGGRAEHFDRTTLKLLLAVCDTIDSDIARVQINARQLVKRRPDLSLAWSLLARAQGQEAAGMERTLPVAARLRAEATGNARKALTLDPRNGMAQFALALAEDKDDLGQIRALPRMERAFRDSPDLADGLEYYAVGLFNAGYTAASVAPALRSTMLNPLACVIQGNTVRRLLAAGRTDEAFALQAQAERMWPDHPSVLDQRLRMMLEYGDPNAALELLASRTRIEGRAPDTLPLMVHIAGWRADPRRLDRAAMAADAEAGFAGSPSAAWFNASAYAHIGDAERALHWLARAPVRQGHSQWSALFWPHAAAIRRDPRFFAKMAELGLVEIWRQRGQWPDFCSEPGLRYDCSDEARRLAAVRGSNATLPAGRGRS